MTRQRLKHQAKVCIFTPRRPNLFFVTLLYLLISLMLLQMVDTLSEIGRFQASLLQFFIGATQRFFLINPDVVNPFPLFYVTLFGLFFFIVPRIFLWILDVGYLYYAKETLTGKTLGHQSLMEGFPIFFKIILVRIVRTIIVAFGMAFFVIPGIVLACMFSQVNFLLLDNPDRSVFWLFAESARLMRGKKMEYFILQLSFFGWFLLTVLPVISYAAQVWYIPYSTLTYAGFYHNLIGKEQPDSEQEWKRPGMF